MTVVLAWWNGQPNPRTQERVEICETDGRWWVTHEGPRRQLEYVPCSGLAQANAEATRFLARGPGWHRLPTA